MALADTAHLIVSIALNDKLSGPLSRINKNLAGLAPGLEHIRKGTGQLASGLLKVGEIAATGFVVGIGAAVKVAGDFEAQLNTINTIAQTTPETLAGIGTGIRQTFRDTGVSLDDLTAAYYDLLSAGVKVTDAQGELNLAVRLGIGGLGSTAEAIDLLTTAQNSYGLSAEGVTHAADIFAKAVEDGKVKIAELAATFADVAPIAKTAGVSLEELGAAYAFLTAKGVPATEASTQINRAIVELLKPSKELAAVQKKLGVSFTDLIKSKGLVGALQAIRIEADKLGIPFQDLFGRLEGYKFALATTGDSFAAFSAEYAKFGDVSGTVEEQFAARAQGFNFALSRLKAGFKDAGITIGSALLPKLVPLIDKLNEFIGTHQADIAAFGDKLAAGFDRFAGVVGKIDWSPLIEGLKLAGSIGEKVLGIFTSLPPAVQGAAISGLALNKLSGGLLGAGVGNIAGGLLKIVFQRGASPTNPLWVASAQGGIPGVGGVAAGGGILGGAVKWVLGPVAAAAIGYEIGHAIFFDPTVKPAVSREQSTFAGIATSTDRATLEKALAAVTKGIADMNASLPGGLAQVLAGDQYKILQDQKTILETAIAGLITAPGSPYKHSRATVEQLQAMRRDDLSRDAMLRGMNNAARAATLRSNSLLDRVAASTGRTVGLTERIANKRTSFTANVTNKITATISYKTSLSTYTAINSIRTDYAPGDSTGGSL